MNAQHEQAKLVWRRATSEYVYYKEGRKIPPLVRLQNAIADIHLLLEVIEEIEKERDQWQRIAQWHEQHKS